MLNVPKRLINFDLECTTWEGAAARGWSGPNEHREVVQFGAVLVDTEDFEEMSSFQCLVKPKINPELSPYLIDLTGITQHAVDARGLDFPTALKMFAGWCADLPLYCFDSRVNGSRLFDRDVLRENCELLDLGFPFGVERFHNINLLFHDNGYEVKQSGSVPEVFGIELPVRPHDALNDARGVIVALRELKRRLSQSS